MDDTDSGAVTRLLHQWQRGDASCFDELSDRIYHELHRIAESYLRNSPNGTLQPTALINEAYMRLVSVQDPVQGRKHFFALAAKLMRQILVDRARRHAASKRGGGWQVEQLDEHSLGANAGIEEFLILEQALNRLAESEPRLAQIVELHYFGGLTGQEISEVLNVPLWTINRDHRLAEAWLRRALNKN
jgi:RNA polymerase sigma factor (TIGR02999 family)